MSFAVTRVDLHLPESQSLKNKRGILKSIQDRLKGKYNLYVPEIKSHVLWQRAGLAMARNDGRYSDEFSAKAWDAIRCVPEAVVLDYQTEVINASF